MSAQAHEPTTKFRVCEVCGGGSFRRLFDKHGHHFARCKTCGLERIDPQPSDETLGTIYGKHYYNAWGLHEDEAAVRKQKKATFGFVLDAIGPLPPRAKVLDLGAATGFLMEVVKERGLEPCGIEPQRVWGWRDRAQVWRGARLPRRDRRRGLRGRGYGGLRRRHDVRLYRARAGPRARSAYGPRMAGSGWRPGDHNTQHGLLEPLDPSPRMDTTTRSSTFFTSAPRTSSDSSMHAVSSASYSGPF